MTEHVHFDRAALLAAHEREEAELARRVGADPRKCPEQKLLELAAAPLRRAMLEFIATAKEADVRHEIAAASAGAVLATLAAQTMENWRCPCVPKTIFGNFLVNFQAAVDGSAETTGGGLIHPMQGGRA